MTKQPLHPAKTIRCLLFDFGDTLWTRNPKTYKHAESSARLRAVRVVSSYIDPQLFPATDPKQFGSLLYKQIDDEMRIRMRQRPGYEPDYPDVILTALEQLGLPRLDPTAGVDIYEALRVRIPESRIIFPDTYATLTELQKRGYLLGVVTNRGYGGAPFQEDMHQIGFDRYFDLSAMAVSVDLGIRKPHADIFLHAINKLGVSPAEVAMVGDSLQADIQGANLLNLFSIWRAKERLHEEMKDSSVGRRSSAHTTIAKQTPETQTNLLEGNDILAEKEDVFQYALQNGKWEYTIPVDALRPDYTIFTLSELLDIFLGRG